MANMAVILCGLATSNEGDIYGLLLLLHMAYSAEKTLPVARLDEKFLLL